VYAPYDAIFAQQCLAQARIAYLWAKSNPCVFYTQPSDIGTGRYGDEHLSDEFQWAAWELFLSTGEDHFQRDASDCSDVSYDTPNWQSVATLGQVSLALENSEAQAICHIRTLADKLLEIQAKNAYHCSLYGKDFVWGSNAVIANQGMIMLVAQELFPIECKYQIGATHLLNYLLGMNPLERSFITGIGHCSPMQPHHRISAADGITDPVPGFLVGGPNAGKHDQRSGMIYKTDSPALCYIDEQAAYASNEVAINWNAPATFLALGLSCLEPKSECHTR
jgi:endoglucanase